MLQSDTDSSFVEPPLKKLKNDDLPDGPKTPAEAQNWVAACLKSLEHVGLEVFRVDYASKLRATLQKGLCLRTDYSGVGGPEEALSLIFHGLGLNDDLLNCQRACDVDQHCQSVLNCVAGRQHPGPVVCSKIFCIEFQKGWLKRCVR